MKSKFEVSLGSLKCEVPMLKREVGSGKWLVGSPSSAFVKESGNGK